MTAVFFGTKIYIIFFLCKLGRQKFPPPKNIDNHFLILHDICHIRTLCKSMRQNGPNGMQTGFRPRDSRGRAAPFLGVKRWSCRLQPDSSFHVVSLRMTFVVFCHSERSVNAVKNLVVEDMTSRPVILRSDRRPRRENLDFGDRTDLCSGKRATDRETPTVGLCPPSE